MLSKQQKGFTLLEIIVTVVIMSILLGVAVTTLQFDRSEAFLKDKANEFANLYTSAADEAILTSSLVRIKTDEQNKQVLLVEKKTNGDWNSVNLNISQLFTNSENKTAFIMDEKDMRTVLSMPIFLFPSGRSSSFEIKFYLNEFKTGYRVDGLSRLKPIILSEL